VQKPHELRYGKTNDMKKILQLVAIGFLVVACSKRGAENRPPKPNPVEFDSVMLRRTACFGQCPVYAVEISATGQVKYTGEEFVSVKGVRHGSIPQANVEFVAAALRHVKFAEMREQYEFETGVCVSMITDLPSLSISVTKGGKTQNVSLDAGCHGPTVPTEELEWLSNTIDFMAQTAPLVYQRPWK
jgi:hypothetical protein